MRVVVVAHQPSVVGIALDKGHAALVLVVVQIGELDLQLIEEQG